MKGKDVTVKFGPYDSRERVAQMLEGPVRKLWRESDKDGPVSQEIATILSELDAIDRVNAAKAKLNADHQKWRREVIEQDVKVEPVEGAICSEVLTWSGWHQVRREHKAKVTLNGKPYCLTHLKRAGEQARSRAVGEKRAAYVEDPKMRAIINERERILALRRTR